MTESFYLTLHSEGDTYITKINKPEAFNIHLGRTLHLDGKWEVGIVEIFYPMSIPNFSKSDSTVLVEEENGDQKKMHIFEWNEGNSYIGNSALFHFLKKSFKSIDVTVHNRNGYITMDKESNSVLHCSFTEKLLDVLGFEEISFDKSKNLHALQALDVHRALPQQLFVYTDIIHHQMVGTALDKLLRVVNVDASSYQHGCATVVTFSQIHYHPVCKEKISSVEIYIRDRYNNLVSFNHKPLTVILHFRKIM